MSATDTPHSQARKYTAPPRRRGAGATHRPDKNGRTSSGRGLRVGARLAAAVPVLTSGESRAIAGGRLSWTAGRLETSAELLVGLLNDPYSVRGVLTTSLTLP